MSKRMLEDISDLGFENICGWQCQVSCDGGTASGSIMHKDSCDRSSLLL